MKKPLIILSITFTFASLVACKFKPAAEDRVKMHENAKRISDSIGRVIDAGLAPDK